MNDNLWELLFDVFPQQCNSCITAAVAWSTTTEDTIKNVTAAGRLDVEDSAGTTKQCYTADADLGHGKHGLKLQRRRAPRRTEK